MATGMAAADPATDQEQRSSARSPDRSEFVSVCRFFRVRRGKEADGKLFTPSNETRART